MRRYCVIGTPVAHSRSPQLFKGFAEERGFVFGTDVDYERHEITDREQLEDFIGELRSGIWNGCNVTMPWKTDMVDFMDEMSETAKLTGSVNTVSSYRGRLYGDSTDGRGMLNAIADCTGKDRISTVVILGCGGAARSIIAEALQRKTGKITIVCRGVNDENEGAAQKLEDDGMKAPSNLELTLGMLSRIRHNNTETVFVDSSDTDMIQASIDEAEVLINSTPLGMLDGHGNEAKLPLPETISFGKRLVVADCVYNPDETLLIKKAVDSGCRIVKGIRMLEEQARCGVDVLLRTKG